MTSSQLNVTETPPMSQEDLKTLAENETDENGLILGKFRNVEELANSYKELEGKLGTVTEEDVAETESESETGIPEGYEDFYTEDGSVNYESVNEAYGETLGAIFQEAQIDPFKISAEFHKNEGEIPEEMYQSLLDAGLSKGAVDSYLTGRAAEMGYGEAGEAEGELAEAEVIGIRESVGGDDNYAKMVSWAMENLPKGEIKDFNEATKTMTAPQLKFMVQGLFQQYTKAMGSEPNLISGKPASSGPRPFQSAAEVEAAVSDPRYGKDVAYTQSVYARYEGSSVFGVGNG